MLDFSGGGVVLYHGNCKKHAFGLLSGAPIARELADLEGCGSHVYGICCMQKITKRRKLK